MPQQTADQWPHRIDGTPSGDSVIEYTEPADNLALDLKRLVLGHQLRELRHDRRRRLGCGGIAAAAPRCSSCGIARVQRVDARGLAVVGCGRGEIALALAQHGKVVVGLDARRVGV